MGVARTVVEGTVLEGSLKIVVSNYNKDGKFIGQIQGNAVTVDKYRQAALHVYMSDSNYKDEPCPEEPNFLVHETDYCKYAIVGTPDNSEVFVLARKPCVSKRAYETLVRKVKCLGYDGDELVIQAGAVRP